MGTTTTVPEFLEALSGRLSALPALSGVNVFTAPVDEVSMGRESIVFGYEAIEAQYDYQTMPRVQAHEVYSVRGFIWIVGPGAGEPAIAAARTRAYDILEAVHDYVAGLVGKSETQAALGVDHVKVTGHTLEQSIGDGQRHVFLRFTIEADAYFDPA